MPSSPTSPRPAADTLVLKVVSHVALSLIQTHGPLYCPSCSSVMFRSSVPPIPYGHWAQWYLRPCCISANKTWHMWCGEIPVEWNKKLRLVPSWLLISFWPWQSNFISLTPSSCLKWEKVFCKITGSKVFYLCDLIKFLSLCKCPVGIAPVHARLPCRWGGGLCGDMWGTRLVSSKLGTHEVVGTLRRVGGRQGIREDRDQYWCPIEIECGPYMKFKIFWYSHQKS